MGPLDTIVRTAYSTLQYSRGRLDPTIIVLLSHHFLKVIVLKIADFPEN